MQTEAFMCGNLKLGDQSFALNMTNMAKNLLRTNQSIDNPLDSSSKKGYKGYECSNRARTIRSNLEEIPMISRSELFSLSRHNPSTSHGFLHLG